MKKICVVGLGYIGLPTAAMFASAGYEVVGVDISKETVDRINRGEAHFDEKGLGGLVKKAVESGKLRASLTPEKADVFLIAVPTPLDKKEKKADLSYVMKAAESIAPFLEKGNMVILESTVPPRTTEDVLLPILSKSGLNAKEDLLAVHAPERIIPGNLIKEIVWNDRIIGGVTGEASEKAKELYSSFVKGKIYTTDAATAEFVKLMENTYRNVNIALANELAKISENLKINIWDAIKLANRHPRVNIHSPGPGVGGHCIPLDPWFIVEKDRDNSRLIQLSLETNDLMPEKVAESIKQMIPAGKIAVLGVAYKGNVDDARETPATEIIELLKKEGYSVSVHDPCVKRYDHELVSFGDAINESDLLLVLADHDEFRKAEPSEISGKVRTKILFDTKNCLDHEKWTKAGFKVFVLGKGSE